MMLREKVGALEEALKKSQQLNQELERVSIFFSSLSSAQKLNCAYSTSFCVLHFEQELKDLKDIEQQMKPKVLIHNPFSFFFFIVSL